MKSISITIMGILAFSFTVACSQKNLSERDRFLQEQKQGADRKRSELSIAAGQYTGELIGSDGTNHEVKLFMQVKDVSESKGSADPILIPKLLGSLRFVIGSEDLGEVIDCPIKTSEFVKAQHLITFIVTHVQFGELAVTGQIRGDSIVGTWNAASVSRSGRILLRRLN